MEPEKEKSTVLIIDDDESVRRLARTVFERAGFEIATAAEGSEGIRQAMMHPPQVVILDIMMEGMHGFEVCRMLRANSSLRRTAIIMTSGKTFAADIRKAMELGADDYLIKPYSPAELLKVATYHMNKRASQP